jgi:hypothetical protein
MQHFTTKPLAWGTASRSGPTKSNGGDPLLEDHLNACRQVQRHLMVLHGAFTHTHGFLASRFVTTLVFLAVLFGLAFWVL